MGFGLVSFFQGVFGRSPYFDSFHAKTAAFRMGVSASLGFV